MRILSPAGRAVPVTASRQPRPGWGRGFIGVPGWVASAMMLGVLFAMVMTVLVLIPPAQRPRLEPPPPETGTVNTVGGSGLGTGLSP